LRPTFLKPVWLAHTDCSVSGLPLAPAVDERESVRMTAAARRRRERFQPLPNRPSTSSGPAPAKPEVNEPLDPGPSGTSGEAPAMRRQ
jgi:hypothetical protein